MRVMNTYLHVVVVAPDPEDARERAVARLRDLEARWSRFVEDSELQAINASNGAPIIVSRETATAIAAAIDGWTRTTGLFDPTTADAVIAAGYDQSWPFERSSTSASTPSPGCIGISADPQTGLVQIPTDVKLDLGGIGKGLAADLVVEELFAAGAVGALVNIGGDLRIRGEAPDPAGWAVDLSPRGAIDPRPITVGLSGGAVATSGVLKRRWATESGDRHHVIDPRTGESSTSDVVTASIIGATATQCEVLSKAAIVGGTDAADVILATGATGVLTTTAGAIVRLDGFDRYETSVRA